MKNIRLRTKTLKIIGSEEHAIAIIMPFLNITAYFLSVTRLEAIPGSVSIRNSLLSAKTKLAVLISNAVCKVIDPDTLGGVHIEIIPSGGYFKIGVLETTPNANGTFTLQRYNIALVCATGNTVLEKVRQASATPENENDVQALSELAIANFNKLGL